MSIRRVQLLAATLALGASSMGTPAPATIQPTLDRAVATLCVNQGGTGGCFSSIGAAIAAAGSGDTISIAGAPNPYFEHLTITKSLSLAGSGLCCNAVVIDGAQAGRVISITGGVTVTLFNIKIQHGKTADATVSEPGAGIYLNAGTLTLRDMIVTDNQTGAGDFSGGSSGDGAGIFNAGGALSVDSSTVNHNQTGDAHFTGRGAGIFSGGGTLTITNSSISNNHTGAGTFSGDGAGIYKAGGALTLNDSSVQVNQTGAGDPNIGSSGNGAGIHNAGGALSVNRSEVGFNQTGDAHIAGAGAGIFSGAGTLTITNSSIYSNITGSGGMSGHSGDGAGLYNAFGNLTLDTSTISGNITGRGLGTPNSQLGTGGGLLNNSDSNGPVHLFNDTIAFNTIDSGQKGAGINNVGGPLTLKNTIVSNNFTAAGAGTVTDCYGALNLQGYNIIFLPDLLGCTYTKTTGDQDYVNPLLGPLQFNGGPTRTHALPANSPAVDAGDNTVCHSTDQRGAPRPANVTGVTRCDIGAFELQRQLYLPLVRRS